MAGKRRNLVIKVLLPLAFLVVLGLAVSIPYVLQQNRIDNLNTQISGLQSQLIEQRTTTTTVPDTTTTTQPSYVYSSKGGVQIKLYYPLTGDKVASPVAVIGEVPGNWSFEADFPIKLEDSSGNLVTQGVAQVLGNWMTTELVPFSATLIYDSSPTGNGELVLLKDNPSGLPQNDDSLTVPVTFK